MGLVVRDLSISVARRFVGALHRHSGVPLSGLAAFGAWQAGELVGVALLGRPVSRVLQARGDLEVTRLCTDGTRNACSILYAACRREARRRGAGLVTYTRASEPGTSLLAVGAHSEARTKGKRHWHTPSRPRQDEAESNSPKIRWRLLEPGNV